MTEQALNKHKKARQIDANFYRATHQKINESS